MYHPADCSAGTTNLVQMSRSLSDFLFMATVDAGVEAGIQWGFAAVAVMIAAGGLLDADRVAETLGGKVTGMNPGQGFAASLVTAGLVATASFHSVPVSTTHVSVGSLLGMGATTHQAKWRKAGEILLAWISTVPCGAILGAIAHVIVSQL